jgi:uncharacterized protein (DUF1015 family)
MPLIRPFPAFRYSRSLGLDYSNLIAPPYDVLDEAGKAELQAKSDFNIVTVDLPHLPPKTVGPDETYARADAVFRKWMDDGILEQDTRPGFYAYEQTYHAHDRAFHRRGFYALVKLSPFGAGDVVPHEKTYSGPIEDRLKLMRATGMQLSPIFGLYNDARNEVMGSLFSRVGKPDMSAELDGVKNDLWAIHDSEIEAKVMDLMKHRPVYIADGHHRYTTALQYLAEREKENGGPLPPNDPANYCLFCLVSMRDPGLQVLPTHRLIGGLKSFDFNRFAQAIEPHFTVAETHADPDEHLLKHVRHGGFAVYVGGTGKVFLLIPKGSDPLAASHPQMSDIWRKLDVAILQHYLLEQVIQPVFNNNAEVTRGYSPDVTSAIAHVDSENYQLALLLRPTPVNALVDLGRKNEVMPQKSTYFYPKLATGMVMAGLR